MKRPFKPTELDAIERASKDELQALQLQRLRWSLQHAYDNVPHYRKAFDAQGVHPSELKQLADLAKFPFTSKKELRDNYPQQAGKLRQKTAASPGLIVVEHVTQGAGELRSA